MEKGKNLPNLTWLKISYVIIGISFAIILTIFVIPIGFLLSVFTFNPPAAWTLSIITLCIGVMFSLIGAGIQFYEYRVKS